MRWQAVMMLLAVTACAANPPAPSPEAARRPAANAPTRTAQPPPRPARRPATPAAWRVTQAGTTGCADAAVLRRLREPAAGAEALRSLAAARAAGGCVTVFPGQAWRLLQDGGDVLRLAPESEGGGPGPLHFWRDQVTEDRPG